MHKPQFTFTDGCFIGFLSFVLIFVLAISTIDARGLVAYLEIVNPDLLRHWVAAMEVIHP